MSHVEYDEWLELIKRIIKSISKKNPSIFEVGGSVKLSWQNAYKKWVQIFWL